MSSVRMCDKCQNVFSELDLGWQTYIATTVDQDDNGRQITRTVQMDACNECAMVPTSQRQTRIKRLERAAGLKPDPGADLTLPEDEPSARDAP